MKSMQVLDPKMINFGEAFRDETIFVLKDYRCGVPYHKDEGKNGLRVSCVSLRTMPSKDLRDMFDNIEKYQFIKVEPE